MFHLGRNGVRSGVGGLQEWQMGEGSGCPQWSVSEIKGMSHNPDEDEEEDEFLREARRKERLDFNAIRKELTKIATGRDKGLTLPHKPKLDGANVTGWEYVHVSGSLSGLQHGGGPPSRREINKWLVSDVFTDEAWRRRRRLATRSQVRYFSYQNLLNSANLLRRSSVLLRKAMVLPLPNIKRRKTQFERARICLFWALKY